LKKWIFISLSQYGKLMNMDRDVCYPAALPTSIRPVQTTISTT